MRLHIDFETRSTIDLRKTGVYRYAEDPTTEVILACYALDDGPVKTWFAPNPCPKDLADLLADLRVTVVAHNAGFERAMLSYILGPRHGWPVPDLIRWDDTAARAARQALPRSLEGAADALGLAVSKDKEGKMLMLRMCRPRAWEYTRSLDEKGNQIKYPVWWEDEGRMRRLAEYCATDVEVERELDKVLRPLSNSERLIWWLTEAVNDRGVRVDDTFAQHAIELANEAQSVLNCELEVLTNGAVKTASQIFQLKEWLLAQGFSIFEGEDESLNKKAIENMLKQDLPDNVKAVLKIRRDGGKSSVAKYQAMVERVSADGRVRGNLMYHGASTGRWSGAGVQLQNLPRDTVKDWNWSRDHLHPVSKETLGQLSRMIRGTICAAPNHRLVWADYAAIEARGVAWLAGQKNLVNQFAHNGKVYEEMASMIFDVPVNEIGKDSKERFLGKTVILGCGYSMGAQKFRQSCAAMGTDISEELAQKAVSTYREHYSKIPLLWNRLNDAATSAVQNPRLEMQYQGVSFFSDGDWLLIRLPSDRKLFYRSPRIVSFAGPFGARPAIEYMAVNSMTKKWGPERTFGGKLTENIVQGICRDLIADAMLALEAANYRVIASVHDEVICELPDGFGTQEEMKKIMCRVPDWAIGFPISAEAKEGFRYGK
jgi:DNA polymerase